jgi:ATP-dependent helicase/nuclease subunit A
MTFTNEQFRAVHTQDKNFAVIAGAGSGKTHVLVNRFLHLLEQNPDWALNAIVAITFTKKAAAEMRNRVREQIEAQFFDALTHNDAPRADRWQRLLAQMDSARITTIHGLCVEILRTNAAILGIDPNFAVAEEVDNATRLQDIVEQVLADVIQHDQALAQLFIYYPSYDIRAVLSRPDLINAEFTLPDTPDPLLAEWAEAQKPLLQPIIAYMQELAHYADILPPDDGFAQALNQRLPFPDEQTIYADPSILNDYFSTANLPLTKGKKSGDVQEAKELVKAIRAIIDSSFKSINTEHERQSAELLILWGRLIEQVRNAYRQAKARDNVLDFDDLERLACELLSHESVRARYQNREIKHVMVDEFQDTNASQWQIVKGLADITQAGALFVVGDPKQSIYAFRGADVSVFGGVVQEVSALTGIGEEIPLSQSFRTHQPLVDTMNHLFGALMVKDDASEAVDYQVELGVPMSANRIEPPNPHPTLEIIAVKKQPKIDGEPAPNYREWEAYSIASRIHEWVNEGRLIYDRHKGIPRQIEYRDVAVLFRAFSHVNIYEQAFKAQGLPYVTLSGRGYYDTQEIWDCRNGLQALYAPADNLALVSALRSPLFTVSDSALFVLSQLGQPNFYQALALATTQPDYIAKLSATDHDALSFAFNTLETLRHQAGRVTIAELLRELLAHTGYLATLDALPDGNQRRSNVEKLLQKAESSGRISLSAFLQYLSEMSTQEAREGEAMTSTSNSVSIMTVHASKGLEFPAVILGDISYGGRKNAPTLLYDRNLGLGCKFTPEDADKAYQGYFYQRMSALQKAKDDAEQLRLFYVGATRAQDLLVFSGTVNLTQKGISSTGWFKTLIDTFDLPQSTPENATPIWLDNKPVALHTINEAPNHQQIGAIQRFDWVSPDDVSPAAPPLTHTYYTSRAQRIKHLAATHIADIGAIETVSHPEQRYYRDKFRRRVLYDAPNHVESISIGRQQVPAYIIGQIVHEALRHWHIPSAYSAEHLQKILTAYAWRVGLTKPDAIQEALGRSILLLNQFEGSDTYHDIMQAQQVYREMPFMYRLEDTVIHGIIDVVFQDQAGDWHVGDYKTGFVRANDFRGHAQRYHLQIGIYASALTAQLGTIPQTFIHYVQHTTQLNIPQGDWERALNSKSLRVRLDELLERNDDV